VTDPADDRLLARNDLAWALSVGGIGIVLFAALWLVSCQSLFLICGVVLGVALTAMANLLGRVVKLPHSLRSHRRLALAGMLSASFSWAAPLSRCRRRCWLRQVAARTSKRPGKPSTSFDFGSPNAAFQRLSTPATPSAAPTRNPERRRHAEQRRHLQPKPETDPGHRERLVGNFFIVLFLGLAFAVQPGVYRDGLFMAPANTAPAPNIIDRIGWTLERWLMAQIITMAAVFFVTWLGLAVIGIQSSFILGIQAGLLAFIPTVGAILGGLIVVLASLASGWVAALSAFILFLGVHALESYVLTPIIQRQALDIPPATLFAFQIMLGVVFGIWGLALALPLMAIAKVMINHFKAEDAMLEATVA
jgi:predicted PurR-regulated permease PerM